MIVARLSARHTFMFTTVGSGHSRKRCVRRMAYRRPALGLRSGQTIVIGAPGTGGVPPHGAAYVYQFSKLDAQKKLTHVICRACGGNSIVVLKSLPYARSGLCPSHLNQFQT